MSLEISFRYNEQLALFVLLKPITTPELLLPIDATSDGFTVPWFFTWYVKKVDTGWLAAWLHDECYRLALKTKDFADRWVFYKYLRKAKVPKAKARKMYIAVKYLGRGNYPKTNHKVSLIVVFFMAQLAELHIFKGRISGLFYWLKRGENSE
jgi:hypothetical protein